MVSKNITFLCCIVCVGLDYFSDAWIVNLLGLEPCPGAELNNLIFSSCHFYAYWFAAFCSLFSSPGAWSGMFIKGMACLISASLFYVKFIMLIGEFLDSEKKKYFKIQANHVAPPGYQYSEGAIKEKKLEEKVTNAF